jgi:NAD(P)-dependent dehydrogenase (short-subunit alcohol dehydrogenase family)
MAERGCGRVDEAVVHGDELAPYRRGGEARALEVAFAHGVLERVEARRVELPDDVCHDAPTLLRPLRFGKMVLPQRRGGQMHAMDGSGAPRRLAGKVAIVTGASKGIGRGLAWGLAAEGATVVVNYKTDRPGAEETQRRAELAGARTAVIQADVARPSEAQRLIDETCERFGRVDVLVNNAARTRFGPALDVTVEDFDDVVNTNMRGTFFTSLAAARHMLGNGGGSIVNFSSCAVANQIMWHSVYTMSNGGLEALSAQLALEFAPTVRVNAIAPAPTKVERSLVYDPNLDESWGPVVPMRRVAVPDDYVGPLVFLASDESAFLTGEVLHVDGGWSLAGNAPSMETLDLSAERVRG